MAKHRTARLGAAGARASAPARMLDASRDDAADARAGPARGRDDATRMAKRSREDARTRTREDATSRTREDARARDAATRARDGGEGEGLSTSVLCALDEGMRRCVKQQRKRAREAQTLLKRAVKVRDVKFFNRLVKDFGNDKQYGFAKEAFERIGRSGLTANVYSYTNLLNAATRVGEVGEMREIWRWMRDARVEANEVAYTVLVKGESQNGNIDRAREIVREMIACGVEPNQRTYSTLLRNCVRYGDVSNASKCLELMRERGAPPDATACEYYIKTMCGELMVQQTLSFMRDVKRDGIEITAQSYVALATAASLIMPDDDVALNACRDARAKLEWDAENAEKTNGGDARYKDDEDDGGYADKYARDAADRAKGADAPSKSVQLFLQLRAQDATREIEAVEAYIRDVPLKRRLKVAEEALKGVESAPNVRVVGVQGKESSVDAGDADADVRIEVCSGHGDWITRRAKLDPKVQWVGIEMRRNRIALTWMKALRLGVEKNVRLVCGMAHDALDSARAPAGSATEVYVNYPDPPEWVGSSQVLVDAAFLRDVHRVLKPKGQLICVTDDSAYAMRMCRELRNARELFAPTAPEGKPFESGVPDDYGASYFDSMWTNGNQSDRYTMRYVKI